MRSKESPRTRVLVIGGWGRCGSTLLDMLLGEIDGFVSAGEVRELWLRGCVEDRPCGCGDARSAAARSGPRSARRPTAAGTSSTWSASCAHGTAGTVRGTPRLLASPTGVPGARPAADGTPCATGAIHVDDVALYTDTLARLITAIGTVRGRRGGRRLLRSSPRTRSSWRSSPTGRPVASSTWCATARGVAFSNQQARRQARSPPARPTLLPALRRAPLGAPLRLCTTPSTAPSPHRFGRRLVAACATRTWSADPQGSPGRLRPRRREPA